MSSNITAAQVKELRERTNAGMMECKEALVEANGDIEKAIEIMRTKGKTKAVKKAGRVAAEGTIVVLVSDDSKRALILEVNSETDFVSRENAFQAFAKKIATQAMEQKISDVETLRSKTDAERLELIGKVGENVTVRRLVYIEGNDLIGSYAHGDANGVRIGTLVVLKKGPLQLAKDLAMQVAAMNPEYLSLADLPQERVNKEKEILMEQTREEKKPEAMLEKIVEGKLKKFAADITLMGQVFVKDSSKTVEKYVKEEGGEVSRFVRFEVGEGIEKKEDDFVKEVMAQVKG